MMRASMLIALVAVLASPASAYVSSPLALARSGTRLGLGLSPRHASAAPTMQVSCSLIPFVPIRAVDLCGKFADCSAQILYRGMSMIDTDLRMQLNPIDKKYRRTAVALRAEGDEESTGPAGRCVFVSEREFSCMFARFCGFIRYVLAPSPRFHFLLNLLNMAFVCMICFLHAHKLADSHAVPMRKEAA